MAWWVLPSFLGTPSTPYPRRPKGTKMQISFKKVKPAAKGSKVKAPVKKKAVSKAKKAPAKKPTRKAPARKASAKKPAGKKIQVNVGAKKRPQRKKK